MDDLTTEAILESISDGVFTINNEWKITSFNRAAEEITQINRIEAIGRPCYEVFKSNMCERNCPLEETFANGQPIINRIGYIVDPSGKKIPISVSSALLKDKEGNVIGGTETFRDLSELERLRRNRSRQQLGDYGTNAPVMQQLIETLLAVAPSSSTVLITGETGTGKEVFSRLLHQESPRREGPFVAVNCAALPEALLESELFGYKRGAFTGAERDKVGRFALAQHGTLFLDEIGDMSLSMQVKLLRVLQEQEYEPLGSTKVVTTNARIICATNQDLAAKVEDGTFREDLYYRINMISLHLPPLRERTEDIPLLAQQFLDRFTALESKQIEGFTEEALRAFYAYSWPGNIRELENVIERAVVLCRNTIIELEDLPPELQSGVKAVPDSVGLGANALEMAQREAIVRVLVHNDYSVSTSAFELGVHRATLYRMLKRFNIELPER